MPTAAFEKASVASGQVAEGEAFDIVLKPLSHPELDDIRIEDELFAIGRSETPFASYEPEIVADLSRRHARIFTEFGAVYIADLGSKNGTTVNGVGLRQQPARLLDGDEIGLGGELSFRVHLGARAPAPAHAATRLILTLTPERSDLKLQPIVVTGFPFLVGKNDEVFSRYKDDYPHQLNYISRRHAHIFLKNGQPCIEDLGSTNGTFVSGHRLDEHAVELQEGNLLAFGGHHFVYKVSLQKEVVNDRTVTRLGSADAGTAPASAASFANRDKTTFVAAADSFLDIFCIEQAPPNDELESDAAETPEPAVAPDRHRRRHKVAIFLLELKEALGGGERLEVKRVVRWGAGLGAGLGLLALGFYLNGTPERELKALLDSGNYAQAAITAGQLLERYPDRPELKAMGSYALLKAKVPDWLAEVKARDFDRAAATVNTMKALSVRNPEVQALLGELEWLGNLERFIAGRGGRGAGGETPIRIYADEEKINALLNRWEADPQGHQRAFAAISSRVPEFKDGYAEVLSHLRKLQSDVSVYLVAIERLKTAVDTELNRDRPEALEAVLKEYAEKYPRLAGLDTLRQDLRQYIEIDHYLRSHNLGPLIAALAKVRFSTPPFQVRLDALKSSGRLPPPELIERYRAAAKAWREGDTQQAVDGLQKLSVGPWADAAAREAAHKKVIVEQFSELQKARGSKAYDERLLAFYGALDPGEDVHFIRATEADLGQIKDKALSRAQELFGRAQGRWRQYRENAPIDAAQRLDAAISTPFRTQARLLSEAHDDARQAMRIYTQLKAAVPEAARNLHGEIGAEAELQRNSLLELSSVLEPTLLKAKLALIGERNVDQ